MTINGVGVIYVLDVPAMPVSVDVVLQKQIKPASSLEAQI